MRRLAPSSSRSSASVIDPCSAQRASHELARLREALARVREVAAEAHDPPVALERGGERCELALGQARGGLQRRQVGRREAAVGERREQRLGLGRCARRSPRRARPRASTCAPSRSSTPSAARRASRASAPGPAGTTACAGSAGSSGCSAARRSSCVARRLAQLVVARRRRARPARLPASCSTSPDATSSASAASAASRSSRPRGATSRSVSGHADCRQRRAHERRRVAARQQAAGGPAPRPCPPWRGGAGSSTRPPAIVACGAVVRTITRSPRAAATGSRRRSCASPAAPGGERIGLRAARRARRRRPCRSAPARACRAARPGRREAPAARRRAGSSRGMRRAWPGSAPRGIALRSTPARLAATRWPASARSTGWSWTSTERTRTSPPPGSTREPVAGPDRARPERARDDGADAVQREGAVDRQARGPRGRPRRDGAGGLVERLAQLVEAGAAARRGLDDRASRRARRAVEQLLDVGARQLGAPSASTRSRLLSATTAVRTPSSSRIATCSRVCGITPSSQATTSRARSMPVAPAIIVRTKRSCPGTSTTESERPEGSARLA